MKFFHSCGFLVFFAVCQVSAHFGLRSSKDQLSPSVDNSKDIASRLATDLAKVTSDLKEIGGKVKDINSIIANLVTDAIAKLLGDISKVLEFAGNSIINVEESIKTAKTQVEDQLKNILRGLGEKALNEIEDITGQAVKNKEAFIKEVEDGVSNLIDNFLQSYDDAVKGVESIKDKLLEKNREISDLIKKRVQKLVTDFVAKTKDLRGFGKNVAAARQKAIEDLVNGITQLTTDITSILESIQKEAKNIKDKIVETQTEKVREFLEGADNLMKSVAEKFTEVKDKVEEVKNALSDLIKNILSSAVVVLQQGFEGVLNGINIALGIVGTTVGTVLGVVSGTLQSIVGLVVGLFKSGFDSAKAILDNIIGIPSSVISG